MAVNHAFGQELTRALVRLGISQREAAKRSRISPGYISNMCLGQVPSLGKLLQFAGALEIDPEPLLAAAGYEGLPPARRAEPAAPTGDGVPLLGEVPGGDWRIAVADAGESVPIEGVYRGSADFCLRVDGMSMWPHLQPGDIIGVRAQPAAESGQLVVARLGDEVTVKVYRHERGRTYLDPYNPTYPRIPVDPASPDFAILGVVAWHLHDWLAGDGISSQRGREAKRRG